MGSTGVKSTDCEFRPEGVAVPAVLGGGSLELTWHSNGAGRMTCQCPPGFLGWVEKSRFEASKEDTKHWKKTSLKAMAGYQKKVYPKRSWALI